MLATRCFTREQLENYLHGRADDDLSSAIELHVESCRHCDDTLSGLDSGGDTLVRTLQVKGHSAGQTAPAWVERLAGTPYPRVETEADSGDDGPRPDTLGDYELVEVLGRGGMSVVFVARHRHLGREVALKVLLPTTQQHGVSRERFTREMRAVGGLDHPSIVRATDAGQWNDTLYLVMERIRGVDLNRVSRREGPLSVTDACAIGVQVARGLAHAHQQGVVHRDIKPSNLILDPEGHVKILDFGLARLQSTGCDVSLQTTMGQLLGTLDYMAPEQASGSEVDARADVYALGATLFKLLTGSPPHGRSADMPIIEYLNRLATEEAARLDGRRDNLPGELVELVGSMLQRDPDRRVPSAEEVARRLEPLAQGADLRRLAAGAIDKAPSEVDGSAAESALSVKECLAEFESQGPRDDGSGRVSDQEASPTAAAKPGRSGGMTSGIVAAAGILGLFGLIVYGIVITLKSPQGEIRIESELDNVKVEVVDEKDRVDVIAVDQGGTTTTLRTGRYRVRLDSPSDGIEVTPREVVVTRNDAVIARVRKVADAAADAQPQEAQRDPAAAMEAQLMIAETVAQLAEARSRPDPNADAIQALEEKLDRLRALSRPIPTEPVYEGRTLADWEAQMKFEREPDARTTAAKNVLKLAGTRPPDERMKLMLDAGSRLLAWSYSGYAVDEYGLYHELRDSGSVGSTQDVSSRIEDLDPDIVASHLSRAMLGSDPERRDLALLLCCAMRDQVRQGKWPSLTEALERLSDSAEGIDKVAAQLTLAACVPDSSRADQLLATIDMREASNGLILTAFAAAADRRLDVPRERQLEWTATYFDKIDPSELEILLEKPQIGPFVNVKPEDGVVELRDDVSTAVGPMLKTFQEQLSEIGEHPNDDRLRLGAAAKSRVLTRIVEFTELTGEAREQAVELLRLRLDQLLRFRSTAAGAPPSEMDTPAAIAVAVLMLTGEVPDAIKRSGFDESGYMARELKQFRTTFTARDGALMVRGRVGGFQGGQRGGGASSSLSDWFPYDVLKVIEDAEIQMRTSRRATSSRGSGRFSRGTSLGQMLNRFEPGLRVDPRLVLEYAVTRSSAASSEDSPSLADFVEDYVSTENFDVRLDTHPRFAETMAQWMEKTDNQDLVELIFGIWSKSRTAEQKEQFLLDRLATGDATRVRAALQLLVARDSRQLRKERIVEAIDRIAADQPLNSRDMFFLTLAEDDSPRAAEHAANFLEYWLDNPDKRDQRWMPRGMSSLQYCVDILVKSPQTASRLKEKIARALEAPDAEQSLSDGDRQELQRLQSYISN